MENNATYHSVYLFNPEHDLVLANADPNYNTPSSARKLGDDLAMLPIWYASDNSSILNPNPETNWYSMMQQRFTGLNTHVRTEALIDTERYNLIPWGWDTGAMNQFIAKGATPINASMPKKEELAAIKRLSHRETGIVAHHFMLEKSRNKALLAKSGILCKNVDELKSFAEKNVPVVFKAPWSGSGKGLSWLRGRMTESHEGWCRNIIAKQGSVVAEKVYANVQDFALLYECRKGTVYFSGFSLFETEKGIYRSNALLSNEDILRQLCQWVPRELIDEINQLLRQYITEKIATFYNGMLGVDMLVYEESGSYKLHPCVEINLRMTMGCVSRMVYDKFVKKGCSGRFVIDHYTDPAKLLADHHEREVQYPLCVENGHICKGYISLTPVTPKTNYRVRVEIE